jgi:hypothetical protein
MENGASRKQQTDSIQSVTKMSQDDEKIKNLKGNGSCSNSRYDIRINLAE